MWIWFDFLYSLKDMKYVYIDAAQNELKELMKTAQSIDEKVYGKKENQNYDGKCHIEEWVKEMDYYSDWFCGFEAIVDRDICESLKEFKEQVNILKKIYINKENEYIQLIRELEKKGKQEQVLLDNMLGRI